MNNSSGIHPTGSLVLVLMDQVATHMGVVALTDDSIGAQQIAQIRGVVVECGPLAWNGPLDRPELALTPGTRIICRRYAGELLAGMDGLYRYRVMADKDIWATTDAPPLAVVDSVVTQSTDRLSQGEAA